MERHRRSTGSKERHRRRTSALGWSFRSWRVPFFCRGATGHFRVFAPTLQGGAGDATEPATSAEVRIEANRRVIEDLILWWYSGKMMVSASRA